MEQRRTKLDPFTKELVEQAAKAATHETLTGLGFDMRDPIEIQRHSFPSSTRRKIENRRYSRLGVVGLTAIGGLLSALWVGIKKVITE